MSITVKKDNKVLNFVKGADMMIKLKLRNQDNSPLFEELDNYAKQGLRTLMFAMKEVQSSDPEIPAD